MAIPPFGSPPAPVKKLVAGSNITLSPTSGVGNVTISASVSGGGSSPLTTKGDLYGYDTTNDRVPVAYDGIPLQSASVQTLGLGYGTQAYNFNGQTLSNISNILINEQSSTQAIGGMEIAASGTYSGTAGYRDVNIKSNVTINNSSTTPGILGITSSYTLSSVSSKGNLTALFFNPGFQGASVPSSATMLDIAGSWGVTATLPTFRGMQIFPAVAVGATVTSAYGLQIGLSNAGTVTTLVGLDVGVANALQGSTVWGMQVGNYNSYFNGNTTFGGTGTPTYAVHVRGGSASVSAIGMDTSTVAPVEPGSSGAMAIQCYQGTAGNRYFLISYNDAGTQRYKYVILNGVGVTWTESTTLPT
jgi:hypothetical protein